MPANGGTFRQLRGIYSASDSAKQTQQSNGGDCHGMRDVLEWTIE